MMEDDDIRPEPLPGLPERPPEGERILWQGAPSWRTLAWRAFGVRLVLLYFAAIGAWRAVDAGASGAAAGEIAGEVAALIPFMLAAVAVLALMAWATARTTVYTITNRRVVMRIGAALSLTLNLPFRWIGSAALAERRGGIGDIPLATMGQTKLAYVMLWPHVRPWKLVKPEPMLRAVPNGREVAAILAEAMRAELGQGEAEARAALPGRRAEPVRAPGLVPAE